LIPNPIVKVLSTLSCHEVRHLLMGGQACVFYGAAEFSREADQLHWRPLMKELEAMRLAKRHRP